MAYFPIFIDITNQPVLVVGGGETALQRVKMLMDFDADIMIVAREICPEIIKLALANGNVAAESREFETADLADKKLVFIATDDKELNHRISKLCGEAGIYVNVADDKSDSSFIQPAYVREQNLVAAFSSSGNGLEITQYLKAKEKEILTPFLGELNELLGRWSKPIEELFPSEDSRKDAFSQLMDYALCAETVPTDSEVEELLASISMSL